MKFLLGGLHGIIKPNYWYINCRTIRVNPLYDCIYTEENAICGAEATTMKKPVNILLIDDSARSQDLFGFALNDLEINYCCRFARNINQAFNMLRLRPADYIFVNMPALNGFSTLKKLVSTQFINTSSIVIYTEQLENALCKKARQLGIMASLQKKKEIFQLIQELKKILFKNGKAR